MIFKTFILPILSLVNEGEVSEVLYNTSNVRHPTRPRQIWLCLSVKMVLIALVDLLIPSTTDYFAIDRILRRQRTQVLDIIIDTWVPGYMCAAWVQ